MTTLPADTATPAYPAVHLDRLVGHLAGRRGDVGAGATDDAHAAFRRAGQGLLGGGRQRADFLLQQQAIDHAVLQGLVAADELAELLAHLEVFVGGVHQAPDDAEGLGTQGHRGLVADVGEGRSGGLAAFRL